MAPRMWTCSFRSSPEQVKYLFLHQPYSIPTALSSWLDETEIHIQFEFILNSYSIWINIQNRIWMMETDIYLHPVLHCLQIVELFDCFPELRWIGESSDTEMFVTMLLVPWICSWIMEDIHHGIQLKLKKNAMYYNLYPIYNWPPCVHNLAFPFFKAEWLREKKILLVVQNTDNKSIVIIPSRKHAHPCQFH